MKFAYALFLGLTAGLAACGGVKPITNDPVVNETSSKNITKGSVDKNLFTYNGLDTISSNISYEFYTNPSIPAEDTVNYIIKRFVNAHVSFGEYEHINTSLSKQFMVAALDSLESMYLDELSQYEEDDYFGGIWSVDISNSINESRSEYIHLVVSGWAYTGGAHGNGASYDVLVDKKTGNVLLLEDFFTDVAALTRIAEPIFRRSQEMDADVDLEEAGFWFEGGAFHLNENFAFTGESIEFTYNPYEIASYAAGTIFLSIPLADFKHLLKRKID